MIPRLNALATYPVAVDIQVTPVMNYVKENFYKDGLVIVYSDAKYRAEVDWHVTEYIPWDVRTFLLYLVILSLNKHIGFPSRVYPYTSVTLLRHPGRPYYCSGTSEVNLKDMGKTDPYLSTTKHNRAWNFREIPEDILNQDVV